ncbi:transport-associated protein [Desulfarculus baarsii DSM 2075]|uniref:Transport-associated protein n=1 Tax=Desulfarculus baarsii (strain ATCC 33931 / DSM 2075 / LMG 7858 / VKM B-1802 / 2st14) TaxID=644282 RepID=E1QF75_DESB2|nr:cytidylate kinase family protein [Desulfarculus baarsii]ADK84211.1 transport-associated protein [Desulfarculus baarsii DSM 2075]
MSIITVSGEMGSLRDELALCISQQGGLECVDRRTLMEAVEGLVELSRDEHQLLAEQGPALLDMSIRRRRVFAAFLETVVLQYAQKGDVVLVGRGANLLLRLVPGVLRVRTVAPLELRASRLAQRDNLEMDRARQLATVVDQQRRAYLAHVFGADWSSPLSYDMVLNMGRLSLDQAATTVLDLAAHPEFQLSDESRRLIADMVMASKVRRQMVAEVDVHALEVTSEDGVVTIAGYVASPEDRRRALNLARQTPGVAEVRSALEVSPTLMKFLP